MPNAVLTEAIDALAARHDLSVGADRRRAGRDHGRQRLGGPDRRGADRAAHEGRDDRRARRPRDHDAAAGHAGDHQPRRPDRHRRHRRRPPDLQRLHHRRADRRRRGLRGRQARQPLRHRAVGLGRPAGGARRAHRPQARRGRPLHRRGRLRLHVRARPPRRHAPRDPGAQGARGAHDLQLPRSAHQPGGRHAPGHRRLGPGVPRHDRRRAGPFGGREGVGSFQRRMDWTR